MLEQTCFYETNAEYRAAVRKYFHIVVDEANPAFSTMDEESRDELLFDQVQGGHALDEIWCKTKDDARWKRIYERAAARMLSMDLQTGLALLTCYDHFWLFTFVYDEYCENPTDDYTNELLDRLYEKV
jgi:hypothetical protein